MKSKSSKIFESGVRAVLFSSSTVTSLAIIMIIIFLFKEGIGIFNNKPIEEHTVIAVHPDNHIKTLGNKTIYSIFNSDITNWSELGGNDEEILIINASTLPDYVSEEEYGENYEHLPRILDSIVLAYPNCIATFSKEVISEESKVQVIEVQKIQNNQFIFGKIWAPTVQPVAEFGILPLILGTLLVSLFAILLSLPLGLSCAIYLAEVSNQKWRTIMKPMVELLAGIPSVVYGFFGLVVIVPLVQKIFNLPVGETALSGSIILAIMALPTIITISEDAIRSVPQSMKEASLALGANRFQTLLYVIIPYAKSGIAAACILGIGRAIGETMAVLMVTGNASNMPTSLLQPVRTIPATIAAELGEVSIGGVHYQALFALGIILFLFTIIINLTVEYIKKPENK